MEGGVVFKRLRNEETKGKNNRKREVCLVY